MSSLLFYIDLAEHDVNFTDFDLPNSLLSNLETLGYLQPTPIQQESLPSVLAGQDLMGLAQTGTGKTAAFVLPILKRLLHGTRGFVRAVIIAPTRELAQQIHGEFGKLGKGSGLRGVPLYGGVDIRRQISSLRRGVEIVIACPGRLLDHMARSTVDLSRVEISVLDEADHMFDMGFLEKIREILQQLPSQRQSLLFSATMPDELIGLAEETLKNPVTVRIDSDTPPNTVTQTFYPVPEPLKSTLLFQLLRNTKLQSTLIFTRTKYRATQLVEQLESQGFVAESFQGNLTQSKRQATLNRFRDGKLSILVATDLAARGIDISRVSHVINFDMPNTVEAYTHRIGRTGRATKLGVAFTLITRADMPRVRAIERLLGQKVEQHYLPDFDYKAAVSSEFRMEDDLTVLASHSPRYSNHSSRRAYPSASSTSGYVDRYPRGGTRNGFRRTDGFVPGARGRHQHVSKPTQGRETGFRR